MCGLGKLLFVMAITASLCSGFSAPAAAESASAKLEYKDRIWSFSGRVSAEASVDAQDVLVRVRYSYYLRLRPLGKKVLDERGTLFSAVVTSEGTEVVRKYGAVTLRCKLILVDDWTVKIHVSGKVSGRFFGHKASFNLGQAKLRLRVKK
jgi:hypothetical protein